MHTIDAIRTRKTVKVLADDAWKPCLTGDEQKELCDHLLTLAALAPYHYKSAERYKTGEIGRAHV